MNGGNEPNIADIGTLIDKLGGIPQAATVFAASEGQIRIWKLRGYIPPAHFTRHQIALKEHGIAAAPTLWKQVAPDGVMS